MDDWITMWPQGAATVQPSLILHTGWRNEAIELAESGYTKFPTRIAIKFWVRVGEEFLGFPARFEKKLQSTTCNVSTYVFNPRQWENSIRLYPQTGCHGHPSRGDPKGNYELWIEVALQPGAHSSTDKPVAPWRLHPLTYGITQPPESHRFPLLGAMKLPNLALCS